MKALPETVDLPLLRAFVLVARTGSFTRAGVELFRSQSAVSLQIRKLETALGARLFRRSARAVVLTPAGERLFDYANRILELHTQVLAAFREGEVAGLVRLGTPEDFATTDLSTVLAAFAASHPGVQLEVTCDLTLNLIDLFRAGALDVALLKREPSGPVDGQRVWREPLVWVAASPEAFALRETVPLVVSPEPCVYRKRAFDALAATGRRARAAYVCGALTGALAAVRAGLGVTVLPRHMAPADLALDAGHAMPALADTEIVLQTASDAGLTARRLADHIARAFGDETRAPAKELEPA
ncbi:LysR family transcriptional regulator [Stappia sp.]|uniref:LysR family transcriptional regulator n=1 Tax=Stappia sp. TaxID=1870903 RepID=UPI0032D94D3B